MDQPILGMGQPWCRGAPLRGPGSGFYDSTLFGQAAVFTSSGLCAAGQL